MNTFTSWVKHFRANAEIHEAMEATIDWDAPLHLDDRTRRAFVRSFQRFELGESGEGKQLLALARAAGDPLYTTALGLLVKEEQKHSALFARGLRHLDAPSLTSHWTDAVFTALRRVLGLRTEIGLFLIAESVAMGYFVALAERAPDPVLRGIGWRIAHDEQHHIGFQVARLQQGFAKTPRAGRMIVAAALTVVAAGAATVLVIDHGAALRACGETRATYWMRAMRSFRSAVRSALSHRPEVASAGMRSLAAMHHFA